MLAKKRFNLDEKNKKMVKMRKHSFNYTMFYVSSCFLNFVRWVPPLPKLHPCISLSNLLLTPNVHFKENIDLKENNPSLFARK